MTTPATASKYINQFVQAFPHQKFVIDHIAKPPIKQGLIKDWKSWKKENFTPYLDAVVNAFGTNRIMYGSDWPVCLVAASYQEVGGIVQDYFSAFSKDEQDKFFGQNATGFYSL